MSINEQLASLNFHDSVLVSVSLAFGEAKQRSCVVELDYYDWEGNGARRAADAASAWCTKRITVRFGFLAHVAFSAPDLVNRAQDIDKVEIGFGLEAFKERYTRYKQEFPRGHYPLFEGQSEVVSARFATQNNDQDSEGYLWLVGTEVQLGWGQCSSASGQRHVPLRDA